jgi:hypothetical protein
MSSLEDLIREVAGEHSTSEDHDQIAYEVLKLALADPDRYLLSLVRGRVAQLVTGRPTREAERQHQYDTPPPRYDVKGRRPKHMNNGMKHRGGTDPETGLPGFLDMEVFGPGIGWKPWKLLDREEIRIVTEYRHGRAQSFTQAAQFARGQLTLHMAQEDPALALGEVYRRNNLPDPGADPA